MEPIWGDGTIFGDGRRRSFAGGSRYRDNLMRSHVTPSRRTRKFLVELTCHHLGHGQIVAQLGHSTRVLDDPCERWTYRDKSQIDYLLGSKRLADAMTTPGVERRGLFEVGKLTRNLPSVSGSLA